MGSTRRPASCLPQLTTTKVGDSLWTQIFESAVATVAWGCHVLKVRCLHEFCPGAAQYALGERLCSVSAALLQHRATVGAPRRWPESARVVASCATVMKPIGDVSVW